MLVRTRGERNFPCIGRGQRSRDQVLPYRSLHLIARLGVAEEEHIPQLDGPATIVLGELVLIKLRESCRKPLLHLTGEWHTPVLPVHGNEFGELICTLDHTSKRLRYRGAVRFVARHFA